MQDLLRWPSRMKVKVSTDEAPSISRDRVAAFRLSRHHLASRAPASALVQVAGDMGGAQAQVLSAAQMSLWTRTRGLRAKDVEKAFGTTGRSPRSGACGERWIWAPPRTSRSSCEVSQ